jgi:hypothetical protein
MTVPCRQCGRTVGLVRVADESWKVVELTSIRVATSLPRAPIHVVTADGRVVPGLRDQEPPRYVEGQPLHWPGCRAA